jgi:hypothetical protein
VQPRVYPIFRHVVNRRFCVAGRMLSWAVGPSVTQ